MSEHFYITEDEYGIGKVIVLKGAWSDDLLPYMIENNILALRLNQSEGFVARDLSFLKKLIFLKSLEVFFWDVQDVVAIEKLPQLQVLELHTRSHGKVNFKKFKYLRVLKVAWNKGMDSIFEIETLTHLHINGYPYKNVDKLKHMHSLTKLMLMSPELECLQGISKLQQLRYLELKNCPKLKDTVGIERCKKLQFIETE